MILICKVFANRKTRRLSWVTTSVLNRITNQLPRLSFQPEAVKKTEIKFWLDFCKRCKNLAKTHLQMQEFTKILLANHIILSLIIKKSYSKLAQNPIANFSVILL